MPTARLTSDRVSAVRRTAWLFVFGQFGLLALIVLLPGARHWTLGAGLARGGQLLTWLSIALMIAAATSLGRGLTPNPLPNTHAQVRTGGLYRFVRHPIYSGLLLFAVARSLTSGNAWATAACGLLIALINAKARWEERHLAARFPRYRDYALSTPRFVPRLPWSGR